MITARRTVERPLLVQFGPLFVIIGLTILGLVLINRGSVRSRLSGMSSSKESVPVSKQEITQALSQAASGVGFPEKIQLIFQEKEVSADVHYAFDARLAAEVQKVLEAADPDYGALAAVNPDTGKILALVSHQSSRVSGRARNPISLDDHLALRATFPSASIFKVVTAAAAIAEKRFTANTRVQFTGSNHTLYKQNVLRDRVNRWTRSISLRDAFAQSVNTVFGKIGVFSVGADRLRDYANRFGFNRSIASDIPLQPGRAIIPEEADSWAIAEAASGFTRETTMSPLQGALIAATLVNEGRMPPPYAIDSVQLEGGETIYQADLEKPQEVISPQVAAQMLDLMRETVVSGTSRKSFRGFHRGATAMIDAGGKTGSLTGRDPPGKYDWFVGFGALKGKKIALAALTIHEKQWRMKSSVLARRAIETYLLPVKSD